MYTDSKSEDVWTSLMLHERGWQTIYIPTMLAIGDAPETIEAYTKQQLRWATGGFEILLTHNPLSPQAQADHRTSGSCTSVTATHYLTGIAPGAPAAGAAAGDLLRPARRSTLGIELSAPGCCSTPASTACRSSLAFYTLGSFRWEVLMLAAVSFPIYVRALVNAIAGKDRSGTSPAARRRPQSPFNFMIPQVLVFVFLLLTSVVVDLARPRNSQLTLATAWNITNTFILGAS